MAQTLKNLPAMQEMYETWVRSLGREDPWRRGRQPTPAFLPGDSHGQRSLAGYSPRGRKESDTTEQLSTVLFKQLVCDTGLTRQVVGEQRPGGKGLRVSGARNRMHKGPAVGFSHCCVGTCVF